ncbi:MAG: DUF3488 and transglutaminase-like domain-containing protein, partial [Singulisphaera sp.]
MERVRQICIAALVALSTILLGMGEQSVTLSVAAVIIAFASVYVTDVKGWIRLPDRLADVLGLGAAVLAIFQWQHDVSDAGLLALLSFVVYGQFVLQLKQKGVATYWLLIVLSLMEAAVSTALNESLLFGILLFFYVVLLIGVLTVFYLYREQTRALAGIGATQTTGASLAAGAAAGATPALDAQQPLFTGGALQQQADRALNRALARLIGNIGGMALGVACIVFVSIPRAESGAWREVEVGASQRIVGFANEVQLGEMGAISESDEEIMEVYLQDPVSYQPLELSEEPLFRGVVLTTYANRRWKQELPRGDTLDVRRPSKDAPVVRQRFVVQPLDTDVLFSIYPAFSPVRRRDILSHATGEQLSRTEIRKESAIEYELLTTGIVDRRPANIVQAVDSLDDVMQARLTALPRIRGGFDPLAGTKALAQQIVRGIPEDDHIERARVLVNYLRDPTNFRYSLNDVRRDPKLDPIEDFVTQNRAGHCEYFASALAIMLRSIGIPARLAVGFKGGDWVQDHYQVRALHAHAWVEAYLAPERLPDRLTPGFDRERGGWLIVDPTGGVSANPSLQAGSYIIEGFKAFATSLRNAWRSYVLGMNHSRQQESLYVPLRERIVTGLVGLTDWQSWRNLGRNVSRWLSPAYWGLANGGWFSWRGAMAAIILMLFLLAIFQV